MSDQKILEVEDLSVRFGDNQVLDGVNFLVKKGEVLAVVGPNGSGKSVMFRALLGLIPYSGKVSWQTNTQIGYVPQKIYVDSLFPVSVNDFFSFKTESKEKIKEALNSVGMAGDEEHLKHYILNKKIGALSGGQFQRIMIAWAIINKPDILLFDEPTSGIDVGGEETIYNLLHKLQTKNHLTIILISHDLNIVYRYANNVLCLNKKMVCFGEPHSVLDPESLSKLYGGEARFYHHEH